MGMPVRSSAARESSMRGLVQVALVALILVTLGGIVLNFIINTRAAAARMECRNNLGQLGLGLRGYVDSNGHFPPGTMPAPGSSLDYPGLPPEKRLSWYVDAWGFVGDGQVRLLLDKTKPWDADENREPRIRVYLPKDREVVLGDFKSWLCPANPNRAA